MLEEVSEVQWKEALTSILEDLTEEECQKMLFLLDKIPNSEKNSKSRVQMVQKILQHFGLFNSITEMNNIVEKIPRNDEKVQKLLRPFVDKLKVKEKKGLKRNIESDSVFSEEEEEEEEEEVKADEPKTKNPNEERKIPSRRKTVADLLISGETDQKIIQGKVVQKSGLRTYMTKNKEKKVFFNLGVADETGSVKVMVYG
ncbi:uncharacterized protein [Embiotoca jacksoni]|uniref:uncharacterized protein n=1 Tax=Embiotoca jacksoni TaxID=100190 RepID=UPI0037044B9A